MLTLTVYCGSECGLLGQSLDGHFACLWLFVVNKSWLRIFSQNVEIQEVGKIGLFVLNT